MIFKHGDKVTLHDAYGLSYDGYLHLPEGSTRGAYGVHTLILPGGRKFRSEGRLYTCQTY